MRNPLGNHVRRSQANPYATREDFIKVFDEDRNGLYRLSFLLTGNQEKAEKCFVAGVEHCVTQNRVFREWAPTWAKRKIVENAIRELRPRPRFHNSSPPATDFPQITESARSLAHFDLDAVLGLGDFERFVFVMSVLEHYSDHECSLFLGCSVLQIRENCLRALEHLGRLSQAVSVAS